MFKIVSGIVLAVSLLACGPEPEPEVLKFKCICTGEAGFVDGFVSLASVTYTFADDSVMATCFVEDAISQSSSTFLYFKNEPRAKTGSCLNTYDVDSGSVGGFLFTVNTPGCFGGSAQYVDKGSSNNGRTFPLTCAATTPPGN